MGPDLPQVFGNNAASSPLNLISAGEKHVDSMREMSKSAYIWL